MNGVILAQFCKRRHIDLVLWRSFGLESTPGSIEDWRHLAFGHVKKKPIEKALLQFAASPNIEVQVCVRVVVNKSSLKPLTAEVLAVENAREIFAAALLHQTEKTMPSRGGASSAAIEETDS